MRIVATALFVIVQLGQLKASDWKKEFSAFGGRYPDAKMRGTVEKLFSLELENFELKADTFEEGIEVILEFMEKSPGGARLSLVLRDCRDPAYTRRIAISSDSISLGAAINEACEQSGLLWEFSAGKLAIRPK